MLPISHESLWCLLTSYVISVRRMGGPMGSGRPPDTDELLQLAESGDEAAAGQLLDRHRQRLRQMVAVRMDPRLVARVDPSDVVQEAIAEAARQMPEYLRERPLPFYPWLRQLAWQRLVDLHRRHILAHKRSVMREQQMEMALPDHSTMQLADRLAISQSSPSRQLMRKELRQRVRDALSQLNPRDRELLVLVYLEQLSISETGAVLGISQKAVTMRHLRALDRLRRLLT
jgi:RNA polymerase sigma-70 factor (ECF subfamily)